MYCSVPGKHSWALAGRLYMAVRILPGRLPGSGSICVGKTKQAPGQLPGSDCLPGTLWCRLQVLGNLN